MVVYGIALDAGCLDAAGKGSQARAARDAQNLVSHYRFSPGLEANMDIRSDAILDVFGISDKWDFMCLVIAFVGGVLSLVLVSKG